MKQNLFLNLFYFYFCKLNNNLSISITSKSISIINQNYQIIEGIFYIDIDSINAFVVFFSVSVENCKLVFSIFLFIISRKFIYYVTDLKNADP